MSFDPALKKKLGALLGNQVKFDEPMARHTSFRIGGPADAFALPDTVLQLQSLIRFARQNELPLMVIGAGTNLLVCDSGIRGIIVVLSRLGTQISTDEQDRAKILVSAPAGARLKTLCRLAIHRGLAGINFALGIPGSVGGAVMMNAGTGHNSIDQIIENITLLSSNQEIKVLKKKHLEFTYRRFCWRRSCWEKTLAGKIAKEPPVILAACFGLSKSTQAKIKKDAIRVMGQRVKNQPKTGYSAGCFFKNPPGKDGAGRLIDLAGLKGFQCGGAKISNQHANFIINTGNATFDDVLKLKDIIMETVLTNFNIQLETEVKILGS